MRVTSQGIVEQVVANVQNRLKRLAEVQAQMSTGLRVAKASDDPTAAGRVLELQSLLRRTEQWRRNIETGLSSLRTTEGVLSTVRDLMVNARTRALEGANDGLSEQNRRAIAAEIDASLRELASIANTRHGSRYLFGSGWDRAAPYRMVEGENGWVEAVASNHEGQFSPVTQIVSEGRTLEISLGADDVFNLGEEHGTMFAVLIRLREALASNDADAVGDMLPALDETLEKLSGLNAMIGTRVGSAQNLKDSLAEMKLLFEEELAGVQDVDIISTVTRFNQEKTAYEAALRTAASVIQPSLIQFLTP